MQRWKPNVTVAAVIERDGRFLMVREQTVHGIRFNQPAGHLEHGETLLQAVVRETREETAWQVTPQALLGIYQAEAHAQDVTYLRFAFICQAEQHDPQATLDDGILEALWLPRSELIQLSTALRGPSVLRCVDDYLAGQRYPLSMLHSLG